MTGGIPWVFSTMQPPGAITSLHSAGFLELACGSQTTSFLLAGNGQPMDGAGQLADDRILHRPPPPTYQSGMPL